MNEISKKIERLQKLLDEKERQVSEDLVPIEVIPEVIQEMETPPEPQEPEMPLSEPPSNGARPQSLKGFSLGELLRMDCDGELSPEESAWLKAKWIPRRDSVGMRFPDLRFLAKRTPPSIKYPF